MKIKTKLKFNGIVSICLAAVVGATLFFTNKQIDRASEKDRQTGGIVKAAIELDKLTIDYALGQQEGSKRQWQFTYEILAKLITETSLTHPEEKMVLQRTTAHLKEEKQLFDRLVANAENKKNQSPAGQTRLDEPSDRLISDFVAKARLITSDASSLLEASNEEVSSTLRKSFALVMGFILVKIGFAAYSFLFTSVSIAGSLRKLEKGADVISGGNLNYSVPVGAKDEVGKLAQTFNEMTHRLRDSYVSIDDFKRAQEAIRKSEERHRLLEETMRIVNHDITEGFLRSLKCMAERTAKLRKSESHLRHLSTELLKAQENERKRIAHEIHDSIGGLLAAAKFRLETTLSGVNDSDPETRAALEDVIPIIEGTIEESRRIQMALRPSVLDDLGLLTTIKWFCRQFESTYANIHVRNEVNVREDELPDFMKAAIYRVLQEAMNNIAKHSMANEVFLFLRRADHTINLVIRDNGKGFDPSETRSSKDAPRGLGLESMRERIEHSGGYISIDSRVGAGTTIQASWPIESLES